MNAPAYEASLETVLKCHITSKHKKHIPSLEKERSTEHDSSFQLLMTVDERAEALYSPSNPHDEHHIKITTTIEEKTSPFFLPHVDENIKTVLQFKCKLCSFAGVHATNLQRHLSFTHNQNMPHTSEWEHNKCYICNKVFSKSEFFKNHIIQLHSFSDNSNVDVKLPGV